MARVAISIRSIDLINGEIKEYPSISKAAREHDTENINIRRALYGQWTHHLGYRWEFINKDNLTRRNKDMSVYMAVTTDKYELPIYIADTGVELAKILGISADCLYSTISKGLSGKLNGYRLVKVEIDG